MNLNKSDMKYKKNKIIPLLENCPKISDPYLVHVFKQRKNTLLLSLKPDFGSNWSSSSNKQLINSLEMVKKTSSRDFSSSPVSGKMHYSDLWSRKLQNKIVKDSKAGMILEAAKEHIMSNRKYSYLIHEEKSKKMYQNSKFKADHDTFDNVIKDYFMEKKDLGVDNTILSFFKNQQKNNLPLNKSQNDTLDSIECESINTYFKTGKKIFNKFKTQNKSTSNLHTSYDSMDFILKDCREYHDNYNLLSSDLKKKKIQEKSNSPLQKLSNLRKIKSVEAISLHFKSKNNNFQIKSLHKLPSNLNIQQKILLLFISLIRTAAIMICFYFSRTA